MWRLPIFKGMQHRRLGIPRSSITRRKKKKTGSGMTSPQMRKPLKIRMNMSSCIHYRFHLLKSLKI